MTDKDKKIAFLQLKLKELISELNSVYNQLNDLIPENKKIEQKAKRNRTYSEMRSKILKQ